MASNIVFGFWFVYLTFLVLYKF